MPAAIDHALDRFIESYLKAFRERYGDLPKTEADPAWPSPCYQGEVDPHGLQRWQPVRQQQSSDLFERLAEAIGTPVHPDLAGYYRRYWSDPLPARCPTGNLSLLFVWNADDFERLRGNLIGHLLDSRRRKRPDTLFFACTEPEDYVLSVDNRSGEVLLEQPGSKKYEVIAPSLPDFIDSLEPNIQ